MKKWMWFVMCSVILLCGCRPIGTIIQLPVVVEEIGDVKRHHPMFIRNDAGECYIQPEIRYDRCTECHKIKEFQAWDNGENWLKVIFEKDKKEN